MKKFISLFLLVLVVVLSGCGNKTAYEEMVDSMGNISSMKYSMFEVGAEVEGISVDYLVEMNIDEPLAHVTALGFDFYLTDTTVYVQAFNNWFKSELTEDQMADLEAELDFDVFEIDMPDGDEPLSIDTGIAMVDDAVNGKTLNDIVITTDEGYSITGLEQYLTATVESSKLSLTFSDSDSGDSAHVTMGKTEEFNLPEEAADAVDVPMEALLEAQ